MAYFDKYGVEYSDDRKTLVMFPQNFEGVYVIPEGVSNLETYFAPVDNVPFDMSVVCSPFTYQPLMRHAISCCPGLTSLEFPSSFTEIPEYAFLYCRSLRTVIFHAKELQIDNYAFEGCDNLENVVIEAVDVKIGKRVFDESPFLKSHFSDGAFYLNDTLISVDPSIDGVFKVREGTKKLANGTFAYIDDIAEVILPSSLVDLGEDTFSNSGIRRINIPEGVEEIADGVQDWERTSGVFYNCDKLVEISFPKSLKVIGSHAFAGCRGLTSIAIPKGVTRIGDGAFGDCDKLATVIIPNSVSSIEWGVFSGCSKLASIEIPEGVAELENYAFSDCTSMKSINIPYSVTDIGENAFDGCSSLREICIPKGQKARFAQMEGLKELSHLLVERDNEELTILVNLAKAYELGVGVSQNLIQATLYYTQAAEKGCAEAAYHLGEWYRKGKNVPIDQQKALAYFQQAAKSGFLDAQQKAEEIQNEIEEQQRQEQERLRNEGEARRIAEQRKVPKYIFFDTETAGLPPKGMDNVPVTNPDFWPRLVQLAWILTDKEGKVLNRKSKIIYPNGFSIPASATAIHHITTEHAMQVGEPLRDVLGEFMRDLLKAEKIVCHNVEFDQHIVGAELYSMDMDYEALTDKPSLCTMLSSTNFCALPNTNGHSGYKWPSLQELYHKLFNKDFEDAHDALADITATKDCFFELRRRGII